MTRLDWLPVLIGVVLWGVACGVASYAVGQLTGSVWAQLALTPLFVIGGLIVGWFLSPFARR